MILNVYAYYDLKVKAFTTPLYDSNEPKNVCESIGRSIQAGVKDFPYKDLSLYHLGTYDDKTGIIKGFTQPQLLAHLIEFAPVEVVNGNE